MAKSNAILCDNHGCLRKDTCERYCPTLNRLKDLHLAWEVIAGECRAYVAKSDDVEDEEPLSDQEVDDLIARGLNPLNILWPFKRKQ